MREHVRDAVSYLAELGATDLRLEHGGRHIRLRYHWGGQERATTLAISPSDPKCMVMKRVDIRRELGLAPTEKRMGERRERRRQQRRKEASAPPAITALPDWHEALRKLLR